MAKSRRTYIFVVGGVMSGVGKGTAAAAVGKLLTLNGLRVTAIKIDPYVNVDAGTMNPIEHGEVFVTDDGDETDQDIGNYERFLDCNITSINYMTTGRVYQSVIQRERALGYGGKCVEVVPHVPEEIIARIRHATEAADAQVTLIEVGGTVGEYQNILFLEAARMMKLEEPDNVIFLLVSYLPIPAQLGEMKTKPTQYAARTLNAAGIQADMIIARAELPVDQPRKIKMSRLCGLASEDIISSPNVKNIYQIPQIYAEQNLAERVAKKLQLRLKKSPALQEYFDWANEIVSHKKTLRVAILGKYFNSGDFILPDVYVSVIEAIRHACWSQRRQVELIWIDSELYEREPKRVKELAAYDALVVPGGFGTRGIEGIIKGIEYARTKHLPFLGLCYGMQLATIEFARHQAGLTDATTAEVSPSAKHKVIDVMPEQNQLLLGQEYGGSMRLGGYDCQLKDKSLALRCYGQAVVRERHRHRYELNNEYREQLIKAGLIISGTSVTGDLAEIIELSAHPFFMATQFHPEFLSRPNRPHPLFKELIRVAISRAGSRDKR
ncbi:MAG: CTP synthase [Candidatus Berkelbacteria bacterium Gr01-1014_85]|uniref:CTP synthase n=1 Tax=Candidatus Berkelbacteria bacterium Gr01-1014_85 TaxID=2017150 RepID=A0A554JDC1_9BACT|nr:MAG: CTP synthase [Candidatus Berkelbacteria bacterium Gr01-1014_85]